MGEPLGIVLVPAATLAEYRSSVFLRSSRRYIYK